MIECSRRRVMSSRENPILGWIQESLGFRNSRNLLAWGVAGAGAYYLWVLPAQRDAAKRKEIVEEWKQKYRDNPSTYPVDKVTKASGSKAPGSESAMTPGPVKETAAG
ncbi:hypothetical protein CEUSTIGMA_g7116.t1 [Chlamydomonas eustigma]|uniref:Uncharacterized protein n=1 Tax=Chlamydomonas eustigma TaxID=1157962 RepID=A0A250X9B1_9CHLO|nr:hypothetical protein CEUSTIGMA_g7116.t1 [Chlamydomonas eustigma]|eukprot:GAX79675.1 hypothetical protein CEUSTIGMA_g7116.t1 [Chlamydomonas eustigma]